MLLLPTAAARGEWIYSEEEGGWKDTETGLVWVDYTVVSGWFFSFDYAQAMLSDPNFQYAGQNDWRMPTKDEMLTAFPHGITTTGLLYGSDPRVSDDYRASLGWWSSDKRGKFAWCVKMWTGETVIIRTNSYMAYNLLLMVRQETQ